MNLRLKRKLTQIARDHLRIETLDERKSDSLDFHECSVWRIKDALYAAYQLGLKARGAKKGGAA